MSFNVHAADGDRSKRLLMISAGSRLAPGFVLAQENALEALRQLGPDEIEFNSEALDIVRFLGVSYRRLLRNYFSALLQNTGMG